MNERLIADFHIIYFDKVKVCSWMGQSCQKYPQDLINYQEVMFETQPDIIIECGTNAGGTALFLANMLKLIGKPNGVVLTCDVRDIVTQKVRDTDNIKFFRGSSTSTEVFNAIKSHIKSTDRVMVILDSDHKNTHVIEEMKLYGSLVTKGCYMITEDGILNGHPIVPNYGPGPFEAIDDFMKNHNNGRFVADKERENKYLITNAVNGYLKKVKD